MTTDLKTYRSIPRLALGLLCAMALAGFAPSGDVEKAKGLRCRELSFDVTLSPSDTTVHEVFGVLCSRGSIQHKTLQITLHGSTYSHSYWDWPFRPEIYSYMRRATEAGYAVLSLDRIGIGRSDHPPAAEVTIESNAYVIHQIVQELRGGELTVPAFGRVRPERVALVGHSLGSLIAIQEAATYGDVDGVVLTGLSHTVTPAVGELPLHPASLDPRFSGQNLPDGYLTTVPGTRGAFYHLPFVDPAVLRLDERTKETVTTSELETAVPALGLSGGVHVPVLVVVGDFDLGFCEAPNCTTSGSLDDEASFYPEDACAEVKIIPNAGHVLNLHFQAPRTFDAVLRWMNRRLGQSTRVPPPSPCQP